MHSFGQEFYPLESIRALQLAAKKRLSERGPLLEAMASSLPQPSAKTRRRIASKIAQRYIIGRRKNIDPAPHQQPFVRLLTKHPHTPAQIELLYFQLCRTDTLVGAVARELFYAVGVAGSTPGGLNKNEFAVQNGGLLPAMDGLASPLTRAYIIEYARRRWNFQDSSSVDRALRVLQGAGLVSQERMAALRGHPSAFFVAEHDVAPVTFVYALYCEHLVASRKTKYSLRCRELETAPFARTLLLSPQQVREQIEIARRRQLLAGRDDEVRLVFGSLETLVEALLARAV